RRAAADRGGSVFIVPLTRRSSMQLLIEFLQVMGPAIAGLLTVPILQGIKSVSGWVDSRAPFVKQALGIIIAFGLTKLGALIDVALPAGLSLFDGTHVEAVIAAGIAFAVHAGRKASEN